jgi:hypothetical protein
MMWHCVWWCDTVYDDVTLCMMMWHCVWWCDTVYDDVTLCMMTWRLKVHEWSKYVLQNYTYSISTRALPFANLSTCMYPPPHMTYMYPPPHTICVKRTCLLVGVLIRIWGGAMRRIFTFSIQNYHIHSIEPSKGPPYAAGPWEWVSCSDSHAPPHFSGFI